MNQPKKHTGYSSNSGLIFTKVFNFIYHKTHTLGPTHLQKFVLLEFVCIIVQGYLPWEVSLYSFILHFMLLEAV